MSRLLVVFLPFFCAIISCTFESDRDAPPRALPGRDGLASGEVQVVRDVYGLAHVSAEDYYGAGFGVGVAQVDDQGLDLALQWALLDEDLVTRFDPAVHAISRPGQIVYGWLQFDSDGFPHGFSTRHPGAPTLEELDLTYRYTDFHGIVARAVQRIQDQAEVVNAPAGSLLKYLEGYVAGVNRRMQEKRDSWVQSSDPRIRYMVEKGLHMRPATLRDPVAVAAKHGYEWTLSAYLSWAGFIRSIPPLSPQAKRNMKSPERLEFAAIPNQAPYFTASNELGVSGSVTRSGRPFLMLDPHLSTHGSFWNRNLSVVIRTPGWIFDGGVSPGAAVPLMGQSIHPETKTAMGQTGTANALSSVSCWYAETTSDLRRYKSHKTGGVYTDFEVRRVGPITVREGSHGRLIGYNQERGLGFMIRLPKDGDYTFVEGLWAAFHARNPAEYRAALDLHQLPHWHITAAFSGPQERSRIFYVSNQISAVRDPNPDGNPESHDDWNYFLPASHPAYDWKPRYHRAHELPSVEFGMEGPSYLHCHNCSPEAVTGVIPQRSYLQGGYLDIWNHRQLNGEIVYGQELRKGRGMTLDDLVAVANNKKELMLEDIVSKLAATWKKHARTLPKEVYVSAGKELELWQSQERIEGTPENTVIARVLYWQSLMKASQPIVSLDLRRLIFDQILTGERPLFNPDAPLPVADAVNALTQLAAVRNTYAQVFGGDQVPWRDIQLLRPGFGSFHAPGSPHSLMSVGGTFATVNDRRIIDVGGGQNYVMLMEVGSRSLLRRSVQGTYDLGLPYATKMTELFSQERFLPTGLLPEEMTEERILLKEKFDLRH